MDGHGFGLLAVKGQNASGICCPGQHSSADEVKFISEVAMMIIGQQLKYFSKPYMQPHSPVACRLRTVRADSNKICNCQPIRWADGMHTSGDWSCALWEAYRICGHCGSTRQDQQSVSCTEIAFCIQQHPVYVSGMSLNTSVPSLASDCSRSSNWHLHTVVK